MRTTRFRPHAPLVAALIACAAGHAGAAPPAPTGTLFEDDFADAASGWADNSRSAAGARGLLLYTPGGGYQMTPLENETLGFSPSPVQAPDGDVRLAADVFLYAGIGAGAAGLVCRFQDHENFYGFLATGDHRLMIVRVTAGKPQVLAEGRYRGLLAGTVDTRIGAECKGDLLRIRVGEGAPVEVRDGALASGRTGLLVMGESLAGTHAMFDDFVLMGPSK